MIDTYPDTLAVVEIHVGSTDPYVVPWGAARDDNFYQSSWTPCSMQDGLYDAFPPSNYDSKFQARQSMPTDVTIDMAVFGGGDTWNVSARVCIEPTGSGKTMDIWMAQVIDHYGPTYFNRNKVQDGSDGVEITLAAGECAVITEPFVLNTVSAAAPENVKFIAWAQDTHLVWSQVMVYLGTPYYANTAEIYQGAKALAPFEGVFMDGFEYGDTLGWSSTIP